MLILLLPLALAAAFLALLSRGVEWRRSFLFALLAGSLWTWILTEGLTLFAALGRGPLAAGWALALAAALLLVHGRNLSARVAWRVSPWPDSLLLALTIVSCLYAAGAAFLVAVFGAPNTTDVISYHMPRIVYWLQNRSVEFFPSNYYQQLSLQPMAEYFMAHTFALSGGDRFVQLVQWTSFLGAIVAVSLLARALGAGLRGQAAAAWLVSMTPNAFLQAGGSKNDLTMGFFLIAATWFVIEAARSRSRVDTLVAGAATGFALLTKGTAYIFAPALAAGLLLGLGAVARYRLILLGPAVLAAALALNLPHYARNYEYNGQPLGDGSALGGRRLPYANERIDADTLISNVLRNLYLELAATPALTVSLLETVIQWHERLGIDPHDPVTSFNQERFRTLHVISHPTNELLAPNPVQTLLLAPLGLWLLWRRRLDAVAGLTIGVALAFLGFCAYLKWQPWHTRMHTPLLLIACAPIGMMLTSPRRLWVAFAVLLGATSYAAPIALRNESRPLIGPRSIFAVDRFDQYFVEFPGRAAEQRLAARYALRNGCRRIAIDPLQDVAQYPIQIALLTLDPSVQMRLSVAPNDSNRYRPPGWFDEPCAWICLGCAGKPAAREYYAGLGVPARLDDVLVYLKP